MKALVAVLLISLWPTGAAAACRLALAFGLDVSGSVDAREYDLQLDGLSTALEDPDVVAVLLGVPDTPVAIAVYEWSSSAYQRVIVDWVEVSDAVVLSGVTARLRGWSREDAPEATGLGAALEYGRGLLDRAPLCWDQTLDVSGDGKNNDWPQPEDARAMGRLGTIRINALVVGDTSDGREGDSADHVGELEAYFRARVIQGPDAFVEVALGFGDYARAMRRKLLRELATRPVGALTGDDRRQARAGQ